MARLDHAARKDSIMARPRAVAPTVFQSDHVVGNSGTREYNVAAAIAAAKRIGGFRVPWL